MFRNSRGGNQLISLQMRANFSDCGTISACATDTLILLEIGLSYPVLSRVVSWLFSMFSGEFCLRLKPYLVVEIAIDVLTEHCCQVCILVIMFRRSDCWHVWYVIAQSGKLLVPRYQRTTCFGLLTCWHSDRPHGIWKMFFTFDFHILPQQRHRCYNYSLSLYFNKKDSPCWQLTQGSRYDSHARSLETSWWIGNKNCQILRRTHSKLRYM